MPHYLSQNENRSLKLEIDVSIIKSIILSKKGIRFTIKCKKLSRLILKYEVIQRKIGEKILNIGFIKKRIISKKFLKISKFL